MTMISLIVNPAAGGGRALRHAHAAASAFAARGCAVDLRPTDGPGHARDIAAACAVAGLASVVVCGGDGTVHEAAAGLAGTGTALAVLACGRGNDFAAALRLPRRPAELVTAVLEGERIRVDLGSVNGTAFCTVAAVGFDAEVTRHVMRGGGRTAGRHAYLLGALQLLFRYPAPELRFEGDFGVREGRYLLGAIANTERYGAGFRIAPGARADDGLLDCVLVRDLPRWTALSLMPSIYRGAHLHRPEVEVVRTRELRVTSEGPCALAADGEFLGETPATMAVRPRALWLCRTPAAGAAHRTSSTS
jgi:YegS/Rv2252/BmrU family lipid kinase